MTLTAPSGWLELDGTAISRSTYSTLFSAVTIQQTGTRTNGSAIVTGLSSTTNMKAGYYVGGTGITNGTTILTVDSATQITMSANASSSGSSTVIVSGWAQGDGSTTFTLPDSTTAGRFRRSRTSSVVIGTVQADLVKAHTHTYSSTSGAGSSHSHGVTDAGHSHALGSILTSGSTSAAQSGSGVSILSGLSSGNSTNTNFTGVTVDAEAAHTHAISGTTAANTGTENRPLSLVFITCVKT